jgi:transposase
MLFVVISKLTGVESTYEIPDVLWDRITPLLPSRKRKKKAGRPRMNDRKAMSAIFYVLRTGCQRNALLSQYQRKVITLKRNELETKRNLSSCILRSMLN